jgi:hypothetical protein
MKIRLEPAKLHELRAKTDRQLTELIHMRLEEAWNLGRTGGEPSAIRAACAEVKHLLPVVRPEYRDGLQRRLNELRDAAFGMRAKVAC